MFRESFPQEHNETGELATHTEAASESTESSGSTVEQEKQYGWNDIIVPEEHLRVAEEKIRELGFECASKVIPKNRQYLENDKNSKSFDEFVLSITYLKDKEPADRETLKRIMVALRENEKHVIVRVARLAPGEHFG